MILSGALCLPLLAALAAARSSSSSLAIPSRSSLSTSTTTSTPLPAIHNTAIDHQCLAQINNANATDTIYSTEYMDIPSSKVPFAKHDSAISLTIDAPAFSNSDQFHVNSTIWLSTGGGIDYSSPDLPFSACSLVFNQLPAKTASRRGESNDNCEATFSRQCVVDLQQKALGMAWDFSSNTTQAKGFNKTLSHLPEVCNYLADQMSVSLPPSCKNFAEKNRLWGSVDPLPLTGPASAALTGCNVTAPSLHPNRTFTSYNVFPIHNATFNPSSKDNSRLHISSKIAQELTYDIVLENVVPIMRVYMPTVNGNTSTSFVKVDSAYAEMKCLKATPLNTRVSGGRPAGSKSNGVMVQTPGRITAIGIALGAVGMATWMA